MAEQALFQIPRSKKALDPAQVGRITGWIPGREDQ
jgi:hypothetical protein